MPYSEAKSQSELDLHFMNLAFKQAQIAEGLDEVPVGALIVKNNSIISMAYNKKESGPSATYHAEVLAIEQASKALKSWRLHDCTLYVTLEPCVMCAGALISARVPRLVFGATDPKAGAITSVFQLANHEKLNHKFNFTSGILQHECSEILKKFFKQKR